MELYPLGSLLSVVGQRAKSTSKAEKLACDATLLTRRDVLSPSIHLRPATITSEAGTKRSGDDRARSDPIKEICE